VRSAAAMGAWRDACALEVEAARLKREALGAMRWAGMSRQSIAHETGLSLSSVARRLGAIGSHPTPGIRSATGR
jgi:hypothetical protein